MAYSFADRRQRSAGVQILLPLHYCNICKTYLGKIDGKDFVSIYELSTQNSEIDTLKTYITTESIVSSAIAAEESSKITAQATGATSWRRGTVKYKKNEAFVNVVETVPKGTILHADVDSHI
ncbi:hypothetical protein BDZ89DRAFT_1244177 [Hymenopellis radicata]|nr:hypothetical protein BDZ89DRAFT_1244177 [Hymenopellis radicata]